MSEGSRVHHGRSSARTSFARWTNRESAHPPHSAHEFATIIDADDTVVEDAGVLLFGARRDRVIQPAFMAKLHVDLPQNPLARERRGNASSVQPSSWALLTW